MIRSVFFVPGKGPVRAGTQLGQIPTIDIAFEQRQWSRNGDKRHKDGLEPRQDREKRKDNSNIPTAKWIPPQYAKQEVLTFRLETYVNHLKP